MSYLLDTNILLRFISPKDPKHSEVVTTVDALHNRQQRVIISPQNLIELWNVCTRPKENNGLGLTLKKTEEEVKRLKKLFIFFPDNLDVYLQWERLVSTYNVKGSKVHDTRLVAFMLVHQISHIMTFNVKDFRRFRGEITPLTPEDIN